MRISPEEFLEHYGVKGMRWGVRRNRERANLGVRTTGDKRKVSLTREAMAYGGAAGAAVGGVAGYAMGRRKSNAQIAGIKSNMAADAVARQQRFKEWQSHVKGKKEGGYVYIDKGSSHIKEQLYDALYDRKGITAKGAAVGAAIGAATGAAVANAGTRRRIKKGLERSLGEPVKNYDRKAVRQAIKQLNTHNSIEIRGKDGKWKKVTVDPVQASKRMKGYAKSVKESRSPAKRKDFIRKERESFKKEVAEDRAKIKATYVKGSPKYNEAMAKISANEKKMMTFYDRRETKIGG